MRRKFTKLRKPESENTETLERLKRWPSLIRTWAGHQVRIFSREHDCYWRPEGAGYTTDGLEAGVYEFDDAFRRTKHCGPEKRIEYRRVYPLPA